MGCRSARFWAAVLAVAGLLIWKGTGEWTLWMQAGFGLYVFAWLGLAYAAVSCREL